MSPNIASWAVARRHPLIGAREMPPSTHTTFGVKALLEVCVRRSTAARVGMGSR